MRFALLDDTLKSFEEKEDLQWPHQVAFAFYELRSHPELTDEQLHAVELETHAWDLSPRGGSQRHWESHYQPLTISGDNEPLVIRPALSDLGEAALDQWAETLSVVRMPFLKARYADLLWDLTHVIAPARQKDFRAGQIAVDAYVEGATVEGQNSDIAGVLSLERAFQIATTMNDGDRIERVLDELFERGDKAPLQHMGVWVMVSRCLLRHRKRTRKREDQLIVYLERRLQQANDEVNGQASDAALSGLLNLYKGEPYREVRLRAVHLHKSTWEAHAKTSSAGVAISWLSSVVATLEKEGLHEEAERLRVEIEGLGEKALDEMHTVHVETSVPREELEAQLESLIAVDHPFLALFRLAKNLSPRCDTLRAQAVEHDKTFVFRRLIHRVIIGRDGLPKATIGSSEDDMPGVMVEEAMHEMLLSPSLFHMGYVRAKERFAFTPGDLMEIIRASFFCSEEIAESLLEGLQAYDDEDYTKAIHVLIPQVEAMLREMLRFLGIPIRKSRRESGMYELKNMNDVLSEQRVEDLLEEDLLFFLNIVFIDRRGWNLRNEFAHGALPTSAFNVNTASAVLMALIQLGMIGPHGAYIPSEKEQSEEPSTDSFSDSDLS
jgi:hypothetical protein